MRGNVASGKKEVSASWEALYPFPGFVMKYISGGMVRIRKSWDSRILNPAGTIRMIQGAGDFITGAEQ